MEFNHNLLEETKQQIKEMVFFKEFIDIDKDDYEIIHDFEQAYNNAFEEYFQYGEYSGHTWVNILERNMAQVKKIIYAQENYAELSKVVRGIEVAEELEIEYTFDDDDVIEQIEAELNMCAQSRFVCGKENAFFESLFKAYCQGGWPCGWKNGKIIVYVPGEE